VFKQSGTNNIFSLFSFSIAEKEILQRPENG
jgi:hypothetical protein